MTFTDITKLFKGCGMRAARPRPGSFLWFLNHEVRLAWRDWVMPGREWKSAIGAVILVAFLHLVGWWIAFVLPDAESASSVQRRAAEIQISLGILAIFGMLIAQAMEGVARAIYGRGDLELVLSSPASARTVFIVRMIAITLTTLALAGFLVIPIADMLVVERGISWATAHGFLFALAIAASALAVSLTWGLFHLCGPNRMRLVSQVVGATIGATSVIGTQVPLILKYGETSLVNSPGDPRVMAMLPLANDSLIWVPSHAVHGDLRTLCILLFVSGAAFAGAVWFVSRDFTAMAMATVGPKQSTAAGPALSRIRIAPSPGRALRINEFRLILRDPWLLSQSLTQILYLIPPGLLLLRNYGDEVGSLAMLIPVLVIASGQLAGGLAWLALSAEDAAELLATAPISLSTILRAKIEAVLIAVSTVLAPLLLVIGLSSAFHAIVALGFCALGTASSCLVQYLFRIQARRSQFRRRQQSSKLATMCETMVSIAWAGASGLAAAGSFMTFVPSGLAVGILAICGLTKLVGDGTPRIRRGKKNETVSSRW
jgi:ABC-2 type transport system permease protein